MEKGIHSGLTRAAGRRFGLTVGGAFLVLAALIAWPGRHGLAFGFVLVGAALALAGLLIPTHLGPVERAWMALAHAISRVTTPLVMGVMYLTVLLPVGIIRRAFGGNPLVHARRNESFWRERAAAARRSMDMRRQF